MQTLSPSACADLIARSRSIVAFTGAGISTSAGIPDFRSPEGLYVTRRYDPVKVFEIDHFLREPQYFYEFSRDFVTQAKLIQPTFTHRFLAGLERTGQLAGVITQNIDLLHQRAGNRYVIELHGSYNRADCRRCGKGFEDLTLDWWDAAMDAGENTPIVSCPLCRGLIKPDIVFFGEPVKNYADAENMVAACDLLLVLGSSLQITPASHLPYATMAATLIVTQGEVMLPQAPHRFFADADLDDYFQAVSENLALLD